jgi:hypothetical protein
MTAASTSYSLMTVEWKIRMVLKEDYYVTFSVFIIFTEMMLRIAFSTLIQVCRYL